MWRGEKWQLRVGEHCWLGLALLGSCGEKWEAQLGVPWAQDGEGKGGVERTPPPAAPRFLPVRIFRILNQIHFKS